MTPDGKLLAWIETHSAEDVVAAFIGEGASSSTPDGGYRRLPAMRRFKSVGEAREWIEDQGKSIGLPVAWLDEPLDGC